MCTYCHEHNCFVKDVTITCKFQHVVKYLFYWLNLHKCGVQPQYIDQIVPAQFT